MKITFDKIKHQAVKVVACARCGKKLRRAKTFWATQNPYNVNEDGIPRTVVEIQAKLREKAAAWMEEPEQHANCEGPMA